MDVLVDPHVVVGVHHQLGAATPDHVEDEDLPGAVRTGGQQDRRRQRAVLLPEDVDPGTGGQREVGIAITVEVAGRHARLVSVGEIGRIAHRVSQGAVGLLSKEPHAVVPPGGEVEPRAHRDVVPSVAGEIADGDGHGRRPSHWVGLVRGEGDRTDVGDGGDRPASERRLAEPQRAGPQHEQDDGSAHDASSSLRSEALILRGDVRPRLRPSVSM